MTHPKAWSCRSCDADIFADKVAMFLGLCEECTAKQPIAEPPEQWTELMRARDRAKVDWHLVAGVTAAQPPVGTLTDQIGRFEIDPATELVEDFHDWYGE